MSLERDFALAYAEHGWPVFGLHAIIGGRCACGRRGCESPGKHPISLGWPNTIASTAAVASTWGGRHGARGIGLALGPSAGMWALDVDLGHGGYEGIADLEREHGRLPASLRTGTGGGGMHVLFAWPLNGKVITTATGGLPDGIHVRGQGGFIVLPPSVHASGHRYRWGIPPRTGTLAPAPAWLLDLIRRPQRPLPVAHDREREDEPAAIPVGGRHRGLLELAQDLVRRGVVDRDLLEGALLAANQARCEKPIGVPEVEKLAAWARGSRIAEHEREVNAFARRIRHARDAA